MMKVLFATTNPSKVNRFRKTLESVGIELLTIADLDFSLSVDEDGKNAIENAMIKAKAYYEATGLPTIGMDDNLFIEGIPLELQPGTHVRRVGEKELTDEEMILYYTDLVRKYGGKLIAKWVYGMVIYKDEQVFQYTWSKDDFYLVDLPSEKRNPRYPLDSISIDPTLNKYFVDLTEEEKKSQNVNTTTDGVTEFILSSLGKS